MNVCKKVNENKLSEEEISKLVTDNINFVYSTVNKNFAKYITNADIKDDLYQAGMYGLSYAANKFDKNHKTKFITYAVYWIKYYVYQEIIKIYPIALNQNHIYKRNKIKQAQEEFRKLYDREPSVDELSEMLPDFSKKVIKNVLSVNGGDNYDFVSFQSVTTNNKDSDKCEMDNVLSNVIEQKQEDPQIKYQIRETLSLLKKQVEPNLYNMFIAYYINGDNYSDIAIKNGLKHPASAKYYISKVCDKFKDIYNS